MYTFSAPSTSAQLTANSQEMRIAERNVGDGNVVADFFILRHGDGVVGKRRASNGTQSLVSHHQLVVNSQALADGKKRLPFALLGTLAVADVDGGSIVVACRQRGANTGIHPPLSSTTARDCFDFDIRKLLIADF